MIGNVLVRVGADVSNFQRNLKIVGKDLQDLGGKFESTGASITKIFGDIKVASLAGIGIAVKAASDYELAFAGVRKTTKATEAEYAKLSKGIRDMANEIPASSEEIASVAEIAGQLGISKDHLLDFTRVMIDMGVATNISADDAATALTRFANITGMSMEDIDRLGSTVVHLGNNLATTEAEIVEMGLRLADTGNQIGLSEAQILSFAGALSSVGINAETGGTAFSRVFLNMNNAVLDGGKELEKFAKVAGMSSSDFKKAFEQDAANALIAFIGGLDKLSKGGANTAEVLSDLGLGETHVKDTLLRAAGASNVFTDALQLGNVAWDENSALTREAGEQYGTFASKVKVLRNRFKDIVTAIGGPFMETLSGMIDVFDPVISAFARLAEWFANSSDNTKTFITTMVIVGAALAALATGFGTLLMFVGSVITSIGAIVSPMGLASSMVLRFIAIFMGIGILIPTIAGLAVVIVKNWDSIREKTSEMVGAVSKSLSGFTSAVSETFKKFGSGALNGVMEGFGFVADLVGAGFERMQDAGLSFFDIVKKVASFLPSLLTTFLGLTGPIGWLVGGLMFLATKTNIVSDMFKVFKGEMEFSEAINNMATMASEFIINLAEMATGAIVKGSEIMINLIKGLTDSLPQIIETATEIISTLLDAWVEAIPMLSETAITMINALVEGITLALPGLLESAILIITTLVSGIVEVLPTLIEVGIEVLTTIIEAIVGALPMLIEAAILLITSLLDTLIENLPMIIDAGILLLTSLIDGIIETLPALIDATILLITSLLDALITNLPVIIEAGIKILVALIEGLITSLPQLLAAAIILIWELLKGIGKMIPQIIIMGGKLVVELVTGLLGSIEKLGEAALELGKEFLSRIGGFVGDMLKAGKDLISGLITGLLEKKEEAIAKVKEIGSNIKNAITNFFGIKSPSRVFRYQIGQMLGEGLILGMQDELSAIAKMAQKISEAATPEQPKLAGIDVGDFLGHANQITAQMQANLVGEDQGVNRGDTYNYRGMLEGATFIVREEADINRIAEKLAQKTKEAKVRKGRR
ncbi:phage tail tape measure protein [Ornithinibacillus bavariensis]|uniref:phage tail tape measure protein n=1 Tax=Ornithinibacillus bavariensis TaxID=545502 RepID=UPI000ECF2AB6|nr:phage tail tape measure protein [Ornithinibacillus sp.]